MIEAADTKTLDLNEFTAIVKTTESPGIELKLECTKIMN